MKVQYKYRKPDPWDKDKVEADCCDLLYRGYLQFKTEGTRIHHRPSNVPKLQSKIFVTQCTTIQPANQVALHLPSRISRNPRRANRFSDSGYAGLTGASDMSSLSRRACYKCGNVGHYAGWCLAREGNQLS